MKMLFLIMIMFTIIMTSSLKNFFIIWMMIELNLMSFIPLISNKMNFKFKMNNSLNYFFIQSFSSMIFLFSIIINFMNLYNLFIFYFINIFMMFSLMIKLAMFPFHSWFINLMMNLSWFNCMILSIIQKILPLLILLNLNLMKMKLFLLLNMINSLMSTIYGLNQTFLKSIFAYSSMNHLSWMTMIILLNEKNIFIYLFIYMIINMNLMFIFMYFNISMINNIFNIKMFFSLKIFTFINMLSLAGMPPFLGFLMKWMTLINIKINFLFMLNFIILMISSTITLFYYMYIMIPMMLYFNINNKIFFYKINFNYPLMMMIFSSFILLLFNNIMY